MAQESAPPGNQHGLILSLRSQELTPALFDISGSDDFTFILGQKSYICTSFFADFISPIVLNLHRSDPLLQSINLGIEDKDSAFQYIISLAKGQKIVVKHEMRDPLLAIAKALGNNELIDLCLPPMTGLVNHDSVIFRIKFKQEIPNASLSEEISFIAPLLYQYRLPELMIFSMSTLTLIFGHPSLVINDEDTLFDAIIEIYKTKGPQYLSLLRFVQCCYLSIDRMSAFMKMIPTNLVDGTIWQSVIDRLCLPHDPMAPDQKRHKNLLSSIPSASEIEFPVPSSGHNGVFQYLAKQSGCEDAHKGKMVKVSSLSTTLHKPHAILTWPTGKQWVSSDSPHQWIEFDFLENMFLLKAYFLQSHGGPSFLRKWIIEGSNDHNTWNTVDIRPEDNQLNGANHIGKYTCTKPGKYKIFRITQKGKSFHNDHIFCLRGVEFFGTLMTPTKKESI